VKGKQCHNSNPSLKNSKRAKSSKEVITSNSRIKLKYHLRRKERRKSRTLCKNINEEKNLFKFNRILYSSNLLLLKTKFNFNSFIKS
jgi:hypothetical protein